MNKIYIYIILIITSLSISFCDEKIPESHLQIIEQMTLKQKIGQMLIVGVPGNEISDMSKSIIEKYLPGGIILYGYNIKDEDKLKYFIYYMQQLSLHSSKIPLFMSIDQEGGRVKRITEGITQFPGNMAFGIVNDTELTYNAARILGIQLRLIGVNMNLAPVLDVNNNPSNPVINTRSFGSLQSVVSRMGAAYIRGLQESDCIAVGKHFPGHGDTDKDSHHTLPHIDYDINRLKQVEFPPFVNAIKNKVGGIMTAHISYPKILNNNLPATISKKFIKNILREEMKFNGLIISDDIEMKAISRLMSIGDAAVKTITAGVDIVLISSHGNNIGRIKDAIMKAVQNGTIDINAINNSVRRILKAKLYFNIMRLNKGKAEYGNKKYSHDELKLLSRAEKINTIVSQKAIYYYGKKDFNIFVNSNKLIVRTSNNILKKEISNNIKNPIILDSDREFLRSIMRFEINKKDLSDKKDIIYCYHAERTKVELINKLIKTAHKKKAKLLIVSTGNPFSLCKHKNLPSTLFTFSNTDESLKLIVKALKGEFNPKKEINFHIGTGNSM
ncbi:MAG: beta-N-acetylhexosaminidase [Spirochaetota bacterium]|nr:beta-N-acetylhexosaminidase [Spirochaetota bacterium]